MSRKVKRNDIILTPWQAKFFTDKHRYKVAVCGRRSGKTTAGMTIIYGWSTKPNQIIWYVAPSFKMAKKLMFNKLLTIIPQRSIDSINRTDLEITLKNGSEICCKGSDNPDSLLGHGVNLLVLDEYQSQNEDVWYKIRPILSDYGGRCVILGTPRGYDHFYSLYFNGCKDNEKKLKNWSSYQITTMEAGTISDEEIADARATMSAKQFAQEYGASFQSLSGLVYSEFDRKTHVREDLTLTPREENGQIITLPIRIGVDFNVDPMTAAVGIIVKGEVSKSGFRELWLVDEVFLEDSNTYELVDELKLRYSFARDSNTRHKYYNNSKVVYPDPSGGNRTAAARKGSTNHAILSNKETGYVLVGHDQEAPSIIDSVNEVNALLMNANGISRLYVHPRCVNIIRTFEGLTYRGGLPDKTTGLDHMSDNIRYLVHNTFPIHSDLEIGTAARQMI